MNLLNPYSLDRLPDVSFDATNVPNFVEQIIPKLSTSEEFTMECDINGDLFAKLCGVDMANGKDFTVEFSRPELVQVRRHRKKRINKKWAKRYGYKMMFKNHRIVNCVMKHEISNDMLTVEGRALCGV